MKLLKTSNNLTKKIFALLVILALIVPIPSIAYETRETVTRTYATHTERDSILEATESVTLSSDTTSEGTTNEETGYSSFNRVTSHETYETKVANRNELVVENSYTPTVNTGDNSSDSNTGSGTVETGGIDAAFTYEGEANVNQISLAEGESGEISGSGSTDGVQEPVYIGNLTTGAESENEVWVTETYLSEVENTNDTQMINTLEGDFNTGNNSASQNTGDGSVGTGDINVETNVLSAVNSNIVAEGVAYSETYNVDGVYEGDIVFEFLGEATSGSSGSPMVIGNQNTGANSINTVTYERDELSTIFNDNNGEIMNDIDIEAETGGNIANFNTGSGEIETGDINLGLNVVNFLNNNVIASGDVLFGVVNIFGQLEGDIVVPDFEEANWGGSNDFYVLGENEQTGFASQNEISIDSAEETNIENANSLDIQTSVDIVGETGGNISNFNTGGGSVETGEVNVKTNEQTVANQNIVSEEGNIVILLVNKLGEWAGSIFGQGGILFFQDGATNESGDSGFLVTNEKTGANSQNQVDVDFNKQTDIANFNDATIKNDIDVFASSGENQAIGNTGDGDIKTGDVNVLTNILNFVNNNFVGKNIFIGIVNVFGEWLGDIVPFSEKQEEQQENTTDNLTADVQGTKETESQMPKNNDNQEDENNDDAENNVLGESNNNGNLENSEEGFQNKGAIDEENILASVSQDEVEQGNSFSQDESENGFQGDDNVAEGNKVNQETEGNIDFSMSELTSDGVPLLVTLGEYLAKNLTLEEDDEKDTESENKNILTANVFAAQPEVLEGENQQVDVIDWIPFSLVLFGAGIFWKVKRWPF